MFGMETHGGSRNIVLAGGPDPPTERRKWGGGFCRLYVQNSLMSTIISLPLGVE